MDVLDMCLNISNTYMIDIEELYEEECCRVMWLKYYNENGKKMFKLDQIT